MNLGGCKMNVEELKTKLVEEFSDKINGEPMVVENALEIEISNENLLEIAQYAKHELGFTYGDMAFGTDQKEYMEMNWYIGRPDVPTFLVLKVKIDRDNPTTTSLANIWYGFNWHEREAYDLLGINFEGHPDLRRIYMPDNWEGHPLREDYIYKRPKYYRPEDENRSE